MWFFFFVCVFQHFSVEVCMTVRPRNNIRRKLFLVWKFYFEIHGGRPSIPLVTWANLKNLWILHTFYGNIVAKCEIVGCKCHYFAKICWARILQNLLQTYSIKINMYNLSYSPWWGKCGEIGTCVEVYRFNSAGKNTHISISWIVIPPNKKNLSKKHIYRIFSSVCP
jgi:hypothetical protein